MKHALLLFISISIHTALADDGQALHDSSCIECHSRMTGGDGHVLYTRDDRIAKNSQALKERVKHCAEGSNTGWDQSQINIVTHYLNDQYYNY